MRRLQPCRAPVLALALSTLVSVPVSLCAQKAPGRPRLDPGADTNAAEAYYQHGMRIVRKDPRRAADAFYWASQIDPTMAQPLYARRIALLLAADDPFVINFMEGNRRATRSRQGAYADSLELRARMLDPFLARELDVDLLMRYVQARFDATQLEGGRGIDPTTSAEFRFYVEKYWRTEAPPYMRAILAAGERRLDDALRYYREALSQDEAEAAEIHLARGQVFVLIGNDDSAEVEIEQGLDSLRSRDVKDLVYVYESKGVLEHSLGLINERQGRIEQAREAYGRALQEDLGYYPAHVRLGLLALAEGDTTVALNEMEFAVQIKGDDPWVQTTYGAVLVQLGHLAEADEHLRRAVDLAPFYAAPYYALGRVAELANRPADAVRHYRAYLARAGAVDPRAADVRARLAALEPSAGPRR